MTRRGDLVSGIGPWTRRSIPWASLSGTVFALVFLAGAIIHTRGQLRTELRSQLARRDGVLLSALLRQQLTAPGEGVPADPLLAVLETIRLPQLPGVLSVGLYDLESRFSAALPATAAETPLDPELAAAALRSKVGSRFQPAAVLAGESVLSDPEAAPSVPVPVLEVVVPVPDPETGAIAGFARFLLRGEGIAAEYAELDANLRRQALTAFALAGGAMTLVLGWAFHRLDRSNRRLLRANHELSLAARTSAVGAVVSHLIHGLRNPLAGLQQFVLGRGDGASGGDWTDAAATARRMKAMIDDVVRVLREDSGDAGYEISTDELLHLVVRKVGPCAEERQVLLKTSAQGGAVLANRDANLVLLILENLAVNAVQATPSGREVSVTMRSVQERLSFTVTDQGPGLPAAVQAALFTPVTSTKAGGTGIGLALSGQLARHLGAELGLVRTGGEGTEFCLRLPSATDVAAPPG